MSFIENQAGPDPTHKISKVVHTDLGEWLSKIEVVLVRPEYGGNIGSAVRALSNMGMQRPLKVVGDPCVIDAEARKFAVHAQTELSASQFYPNLKEALGRSPSEKALVLASTARAGSAHRPHPLLVREAVEKALAYLLNGDFDRIVYVFGCEADGLANEDIALCDWVVSIPSSSLYRSLNLAQAILIFAYETRSCLLAHPFNRNGDEKEAGIPVRPSQKEKLVRHALETAEAVGFVLPGDPYKMLPKLEAMLDRIPKHIPEASTWHGLLNQVCRSVKKGSPDIRGRYKRTLLNGLAKNSEGELS